jgi:hypothetical protein
MYRSSSQGFNKYDASHHSENVSKWQDNNMYTTSYFKMSEKNVIYNIILK